MKIKSDFITNSSSTNYIMLFKGKDKRSLYNAIKDSDILLYEQIGEYDSESDKHISCNENDLVESLIKHKRKIKTKSIDEIIENLQTEVEKWDEYFLDKENFRMYHMKYYIESLARLKTVEKAKELGFEKGIEVEYGDGGGCGIEEGTDLSKLMDWNKLEIFNDDLIVINESRH